MLPELTLQLLSELANATSKSVTFWRQETICSNIKLTSSLTSIRTRYEHWEIQNAVLTLLMMSSLIVCVCAYVFVCVCV